MVLPLALGAMAVGAVGGTYFNAKGARKRKRAIKGVASQQEADARWESEQRDAEALRGIQEYGGLSRERTQGMDAMLAGYTGPVTAPAPVQVTGDPRFALDSVAGGGSGAGWGSNVRQRIDRGQALQDVVRANQARAMAERTQQAGATGGFDQTVGRLGRRAVDYGNLASIRDQVLENQLMQRRAALERASMKAGQAGSEDMLYGGLFSLGGKAGASFL